MQKGGGPCNGQVTPRNVPNILLCLQKAFAEGVKLYEQDQYGEAITFFEEALTQYFKADLECRALCEGPQRFVEQDHVLYRYSLYELISGETPEDSPGGVCLLSVSLNINVLILGKCWNVGYKLG